MTSNLADSRWAIAKGSQRRPGRITSVVASLAALLLLAGPLPAAPAATPVGTGVTVHQGAGLGSVMVWVLWDSGMVARLKPICFPLERDTPA